MFKKIKVFLFENRTLRQTIVKNTFWLSFGEIAGRLIRVFVVIYAARVLGAEQWGIFSYAISLVALFTIFSDLGLGVLLTREAAKSAGERNQYFATAFIIKLFLIAFSIILILVGIPYATTIPLSQELVFILLAVFIFDSLRAFATALFRAIEKMEREAFVNIAAQIIILIAGVIAIKQYASPEHLAFAYALGAGGGLLLAVYFLKSYLKNLFVSFKKELIGPILEAAWPISIAGILSVIMLNVDTIMLGWLRGATEVGFYSAAQKPILFLYMIPSLIAGAFFPTLSRLASEHDKEKFKNILEKGLVALYLLALPSVIGLSFTAHQIINLLYGEAFQPAAAPLIILSLTLLATFPMPLIYYSLFAYNKQKDLAFFGAIGAISNVALNLFLIPQWGMAGAAWATLASQLITIALIWVRMKQIHDFSVLRSLTKSILATLGMGAVIIIAQQLFLPILFIITLAIITYGVILILLKEKIVGDLFSIIKE